MLPCYITFSILEEPSRIYTHHFVDLCHEYLGSTFQLDVPRARDKVLAALRTLHIRNFSFDFSAHWSCMLMLPTTLHSRGLHRFLIRFNCLLTRCGSSYTVVLFLELQLWPDIFDDSIALASPPSVCVQGLMCFVSDPLDVRCPRPGSFC